jgi:hypothetical protein
MPDVNQIRSLLGDHDFRTRIVRTLISSTVALFGVFGDTASPLLKLAGTGTLAILGDSYGILTAAHVWNEVLISSKKVGITLTDNITHRFLMETAAIQTTTLPVPDCWSERGPDLAFLRLPAELVGRIQAYQVFEDVNKPSKTLGVEALECWVVMGTPNELGSFTNTHATVVIVGTLLAPPKELSENYDYYEFEMNTTSPGMPKDYGGYSGGGLWRVMVFYSPVTGEVDWANRLKGVTFWQHPIVNDLRVLRAHGPESILALIETLRESAVRLK